MKANQFSKDNDGQVGIGTMIVFIATILVAAVAAGVLIDTSQKLQDKSTRTGTDAVNNVGTTFTVLNVWGQDGDGDQLLDDLFVDVQLASGATSVDLKGVAITYNDGGVLVIYQAIGSLKTADVDAIDDEFWMDRAVRDRDGSVATDVLNKDDVIRIGFGDSAEDTPSHGLEDLGSDTDVKLTLATPTGSPTSLSFTTPAHINANAFVRLL